MVTEARRLPFTVKAPTSVGAVFGLGLVGLLLVWLAINLAHGDVFMLGGLLSATIATLWFGLASGQTGIVVWLSVLGILVIAMAFCGGMNATIEFIAYRPLRGAPRLAPLITAIGVSFILQNIGLVWKGPNYIEVVDVFPNSAIFNAGGVKYTWEKL